MLIKYSNKAPTGFTINQFQAGDVLKSVGLDEFYLVVNSENDKKQVISLSDNKIIRDARRMRFVKASASLVIDKVYWGDEE